MRARRSAPSLKLSIKISAAGRSYESGRGIEQDLVEAVHWYARAAGNDDVPDERALAGPDGLMSREAKQSAAAVMLRQADWLLTEGCDLADATAHFNQTDGVPAEGEFSADLLIALAEGA